MHGANDLANIHRPACVFTVCAYIHSGCACGEFDCNKVTKYVDYAQASRALLIFGMWADKLGEGAAFVLLLCSYTFHLFVGFSFSPVAELLASIFVTEFKTVSSWRRGEF